MIKIYHGDCLDKMREIEDNSVDSLVSDPPAGISFMGKAWDDDKGGRKQWIAWMEEVMTEAMRVLKPGGHGLVWAIPRTSHWTATALENAGFEVRDVVTHLFGTGFPKSHNISKSIDKDLGGVREVIGTLPAGSGPLKTGHVGSTGGGMSVGTARSSEIKITKAATDEAKQWDGWGTALKPASEHWILVRKPLSEKTVAKNVLKWGTGGINIDESRIEGVPPSVLQPRFNTTGEIYNMKTGVGRTGGMSNPEQKGRFPANVVLDEEAAEALDEQSGVLKSGELKGYTCKGATPNGHLQGKQPILKTESTKSEGGVSRFFYCAKASKKDKGEGNGHPTVKNTKLMEYLIKLITPPGGIVLDPFMGSGSTGVAAVRLGFGFSGLEKEEEYYNISKERITKAIEEKKCT